MEVARNPGLVTRASAPVIPWIPQPTMHRCCKLYPFLSYVFRGTRCGPDGLLRRVCKCVQVGVRSGRVAAAAATCRAVSRAGGGMRSVLARRNADLRGFSRRPRVH